MYLVFGVGLTVLLLLVGHWFPWPVKLHRLAAYTVGSGSVLAGAALWLLLSNQGGILFGLIVLYAAGGATTALAYVIDNALRARVLNKVLSNDSYERD
jgi:hypothetical protein